jgi:YHS domain-containing protein
MLRFVLILILIALVARAFWRVVDGILAGISGRPARTPPGRRMQMVRDPVCGTFVLPDQAVVLADGSRRLFFCSTDCRDKYRARPSTGSGRPEPVEGRPA